MNDIISNIPPSTLHFIVGAIFSVYYNWRKSLKASSRAILCLKRPEGATWLDDDAFAVLTAICDALIPHIEPEDLTMANLRSAVDAICPGVFEALKFTSEDLNRHKTHLSRGAIESKLPETVALIMQQFVYEKDRKEVSLLLKLLSTSLGGFIFSLKLAPFQYLPEKTRSAVMLSLRNSPIQQLRAAYQTFKRVCGNIFLSGSEPGQPNPSWSDLDYDPITTIHKKRADSKQDKEECSSASSSCQTFKHEESPYVFSFHSPLTFDPRTRTFVNQFESTASILTPPDADHEPGWELQADVVIVGSGSGGGTLAHELVLAGYDVLVLEKGGYFDKRDFKKWREPEAFARAFERGGLSATADGNMLVLAGACVGGGSTINWSASFAPPAHVLSDWAASGLTQFSPGGGFEDSIQAAHVLFGVNCRHSFRHDHDEVVGFPQGLADPLSVHDDEHFAVNVNNALLWKGAKKAGFEPSRIPRNVSGCVDCGHCCHGCPHGSKLSTITNLMEPILQSQGTGQLTPGKLRIIPYCHADRILTETVADGRIGESAGYTTKAVGVEGVVWQMPQGDAAMAGAGGLPAPALGFARLTVKAPIVVGAAGSLHTPALLLRSELKNPKIGKHLSLHPVYAVAGYFPELDTGLSTGVSMGVLVNTPPIHATGPGEKAHRIAIETPPIHPGLFGTSLPWSGSALGFKTIMLNYKHVAAFLALSRDRSQEKNCITLCPYTGNPVINYTVAEADKPMLRVGLEKQLEMMRAAGAAVVFPLHETYPWLVTHNKDGSVRDEAAVKKYVDDLLNDCFTPSRSVSFSAHQMGTCRMSATPSEGVVRPSGETWECRNLFLSDASIFPTSLGINPMLTVASFAHHVSKQIIARLSEERVTSRVTSTPVEIKYEK